jgi:hypothetical protein
MTVATKTLFNRGTHGVSLVMKSEDYRPKNPMASVMWSVKVPIHLTYLLIFLVLLM